MIMSFLCEVLSVLVLVFYLSLIPFSLYSVAYNYQVSSLGDQTLHAVSRFNS